MAVANKKLATLKVVLFLASAVAILSVPPLLFVVWQKLQNCAADQSAKPPLLLLISYDGFRYDYLEHAKAPNLKWLLSNGVYVPDGLKNTFVTVTAPNHYSLVTGLFEESHGIIANDFYDPVLNETFDYYTQNEKTDPRFFRGTTPVWVTNDKAGGDRATGCIMWIGCDIKIDDSTPRFHMSWNESIPWQTRVDTLISWFSHPTTPINFGILYIEEPDETGHNFGPLAKETIEAVERLDELTGHLLWSLYKVGLFDRMNLIFTSDHGMATVPAANLVNLDQYVDPKWYTNYGGSPNINALPAPGKEQLIYDKLKNVPHVTVWRKNEIPDEYHYKNAHGVLPLQFEADLNWEMTSAGARENLPPRAGVNDTGEHGYNNSLTDMHPYFIAHGPAFKRGYNATKFMNLDVYLLMCYILKVNPSPNNASFERVRSILIDGGDQWKTSTRFSNNRDCDFSQMSNSALVVLLTLSLIVVFLTIAACIFSKQQQQTPEAISSRRLRGPIVGWRPREEKRRLEV